MHSGSQQNLIVIEGRATYERIAMAIRDVETEEAICRIQNFLKIYPDFAQAHNDLAVYFYKAGNQLKALAHYEKAHKLAPKNITFLKNLADFYMVELEWTDDAIHIYLDILKDNPFDVEVLNSLGAISLRIGRKEQSRQYYNRSLQLDSGSREARQGLLMLGVAVPEEVVTTGQSADDQMYRTVSAPRMPFPAVQQPAIQPVQNARQNPEVIYRSAVELVGNGNREAAIRTLEQLVAESPDFAIAHNDLGVFYQQTGKMDAALRHQELAASLEPGNAVFRKNLADLLFIGFGRYEEALTIYVALLSKTPKDTEILKAIAMICIELDQPANARHFLELLLVLQPWDMEARQTLSRIDENNRSEARHPAAVILSPEEMLVNVQQLVHQEKTAEARLLLEKIIQQYGTYAVAYNDLGVLLYQSGDIQGARSCYERAVELEPASPSFRKNLADLYFAELGMTDEAIYIYLELLRQQPRDVETLENLGAISKALGRDEESRVFFRRVLEIEPWNERVRAEL